MSDKRPRDPDELLRHRSAVLPGRRVWPEIVTPQERKALDDLLLKVNRNPQPRKPPIYVPPKSAPLSEAAEDRMGYRAALSPAMGPASESAVRRAQLEQYRLGPTELEEMMQAGAGFASPILFRPAVSTGLAHGLKVLQGGQRVTARPPPTDAFEKALFDAGIDPNTLITDLSPADATRVGQIIRTLKDSGAWVDQGDVLYQSPPKAPGPPDLK